MWIVVLASLADLRAEIVLPGTQPKENGIEIAKSVSPGYGNSMVVADTPTWCAARSATASTGTSGT